MPKIKAGGSRSSSIIATSLLLDYNHAALQGLAHPTTRRILLTACTLRSYRSRHAATAKTSTLTYFAVIVKTTRVPTSVSFVQHPVVDVVTRDPPRDAGSSTFSQLSLIRVVCSQPHNSRKYHEQDSEID